MKWYDHDCIYTCYSYCVSKMADAVIEANQGEEAAPAVEEEVAEEA